MTGATSITFNITSIPEGATHLKQIKINGDDGTTASIKSITLNYAEAPSISNVQLTLGADIALQFYVPADSFGYNAYSNPVLSAVVGKDYEVVANEYTYDENTNSYVFRVDGIASILMSKNITVTLTSTAPDGREHIVEKGPIKISDLCDYYIENGNENVSELSAALKNYGYASEIYENGTSNIVPTEIEDVFAELGGVKAVQGALARTNKPSAELATWKSVNLFLDDSITLNFKFSTAETIDRHWKAEVVYGHGGAKVTDITEFEAVGNNVYKISFNTWSAEDFSAPVAITLVNGDTRISYTLHYSILDYAISAESRDLGADDTQSQNLRLLTRALLRYIAALDLYNGRTSWDMDGMRAIYVYFYGEPETEEPDAPTEIPQTAYYVSSGNGIYDNTNKTLSGLSSWQTPTVLSVNTIEGGWRNVESVTFTLGNTVGYGGVTALFADGTEEYLCGWQEFNYVTTFSEVISEANRSKELIGFRYARGDSNSVLLGITLNYVEGYVPEIPDQPVDSTGYSGFLRASGTKVVDQNGKEYVIKAMGFSNYSMNYYSTAINIDGVHHTEASFAEVKEMGFNTVRFLINYNLFEDDNNPYVYKQSGFDWINKNIQWAKNNGLRIILDMHTPQGGYQSWDREQYKIDGYNEGDALWLVPENQKRLTALWKEIAQRYANEETIIGYSIVNEPVVAMDGLSTNGYSYLSTSNSIYTKCMNAYKELMDTTIAAIRTVDTNHIIFSQRICAYVDPDLDWANWVDVKNLNFVLSSDKNVVYEFHFYKPGTYSTQDTSTSYGSGKTYTYENDVLPYLQQYKNFSTANNVPLFAGEYGLVNACFYNNKGGQQWVSDVLSYFIENGIGSAYHMYYGGSRGGYDYGMYTTWGKINVGSSERDSNVYNILVQTLAKYE